MRIDTRKRKNAMVGMKQVSGEEQMLRAMFGVIQNGKKALDSVMLDMGRTVAESIMLMEREELAGPDYYPTNPRLQKWAHEDGGIFIGDQKVKATHPRLRDAEDGEVVLKSYQSLRSPGVFSEELLEKVLRGVSARKYGETVIEAANAFGVSPTAVSSKIIEITGQKLRQFKERRLADFKPFALFVDTIHRGGEAFLVALGVDMAGEKKALGFWQGNSENHDLCEELFQDLERRGLVLGRRIIFVTDGGSGLIKALRNRFGKKLIHQRCAIHKSRNLQKHLAKEYRKEAHRRLKAALEQTSYWDAKNMLKELEGWLRKKNESAADSLLEAFEELLTLHRLKIPPMLRTSLMTTNPIESMFSTVRHCERNIKRTRGSKMLQRWLGAVLLYCEKQFKRVEGYKLIAQAVASIEALELAEKQPADSKEAA